MHFQDFTGISVSALHETHYDSSGLKGKLTKKYLESRISHLFLIELNI